MRRQDIHKYLDVAVCAAKTAGEYLFASASGHQVVYMDSGHDLKLQADKASERIIVKYLQKYSAFPILSEECGLIGSAEEDICWIVDPLDGTVNYSRMIPFSCVSIGLWEGGKAVLGVVYDFNRKELFSGAAGQCAWLNGRKIKVSGVRKKQGAILATGFPVKADLSAKGIEGFTRRTRAYKKIRFIGSAALSLAYVAAGKFDAYAENDIMFWDVAGGIALVQAAGGKVIMRPAGRVNSYNVSACNGNFRM